MRRVVYYTERGARTPHLEDAQVVGIKRMALVDVVEKPTLPNNRAAARYNLKHGIVFN